MLTSSGLRAAGSHREDAPPVGPRSLARVYASPLSLVLCWIGLFSVTWDRLANVAVGGYNVKLPVLAFFSSLVISLLERPRYRSPPRVRSIYYLVSILLTVYAGALLFGIDRHAGLGQFFTVLLGAILPLSTIERVARIHGSHLSMLSAFIAGGIAASVFGLYQLTAGYTGLPQFIEYDGLGGNAGRISSFAYEPAYFGYFLILVLAVMAGRDVLDPRRRSLAGLLTVLTALALCNSRAVFFTVPLLILLSLGSGRVGLGRVRSPALAFSLILVALFSVAYQPGAAEFVRGRLDSAFDPNEASSNTPRLEGYSATLDIIRDHPFGIGPGSLRAVGPDYGFTVSEGASANSVITNNIWLQSMLDGGILLSLAQFALVVGVVLLLWSRTILATRLIVAGWLTIVIVGGMLTSFFYDIRLWAALGLALGVAAVRDVTETS